MFHYVLHGRPEGDYQALGMFILPAIWSFVSFEVRIVEVQDGNHVFVRNYPACPTPHETRIFLVPKNGHMM